MGLRAGRAEGFRAGLDDMHDYIQRFRFGSQWNA